MQIFSDKLFLNPVDKIEIFSPENIKLGFKKLESLKEKGLHLVGYLRYDLKHASTKPLMYFEAFEDFQKYKPSQVDKKIGIICKPKITKEQFFQAIKKIKDNIANGITYEVNYTYPSNIETNATEFELYEYLLTKQKTPYNAFLKNDYETILSFSPELFFTLNGKKILTKPMKGTAPKEAGMKDFLYNDEKNRSENIMIVDLLRNDLGQIAKTGTVKVDKLFEIEEHPSVYQMTSEISAELQEDISLYEIFKAIFPCGSITGAPKLSTMRVIEETEPFSREIYCGAIGYIHKDKAIFSVPIRIIYGNDNDFTFNSGGAIVWDSTAEDEWQETITKRKFLETDFSLIETAIDDWPSHVARMKNSAKELDFKWNEKIENITLQKDVITRVLLHKDGNFEISTRELNPIASNKIKIEGVINSSNPFLYHKTTIRDNMPVSLFDTIRVNERGEITEGTFTNIAIEKDGEIFTPPVSCGLLNGTYRAKMNFKEKVLYPQDLKNADKIYCFNSVRKMVEVELC